MRVLVLIVAALVLAPVGLAGHEPRLVGEDLCLEQGTLAPGERVRGDTRVTVNDHRRPDRPNDHSGDHVYRVELAAPATLRVDLTTPWDNPFVPGEADSGWPGLLHVRASCGDPASEVAWSGRFQPLLLADPGRSDLWRTLPAGTYWLFVDGVGSEGPYEVGVDEVPLVAPTFTTAPSRHAHPDAWTTVGVRNANRDTTFRVGGFAVDAVVPADSAVGHLPGDGGAVSEGQPVRLFVPAWLPEGDHVVEAGNGGLVVSRCCLTVVDDVHPEPARVVLAVVAADPPASGGAYRQDEDVTLHVSARNEGGSTSAAGPLCLFASGSVGGNWLDVETRIPSLAPGAEALVSATFGLDGRVGDVLVRASCAPQPVGPALLVADDADEVVLHVVVDGRGVGV